MAWPIAFVHAAYLYVQANDAIVTVPSEYCLDFNLLFAIQQCCPQFCWLNTIS